MRDPLAVLTDPEFQAALGRMDTRQAVAAAYALGLCQQQLALRLVAAAPIEPAVSSTAELLTVREAASHLKISPDWLYRHADSLPFTRRLGRSLRFDLVGIQRWLATRR